MYSFKEIKTVPPSKQLIDICLSATNRKTPTVIHPGFKITRIRSFYMRKVKYCQTVFTDRFQAILEGFPKIDDIHPFYADLCNVLYDRDHYKLALGQVSTTKRIIDSIARDYVRMMKYADSLYKCKKLKRAALGRMATAVKRADGTLAYLEQVRQHLGRLPSINPATRTLILCGYPNVGKSSFMNIVTNAKVDVQPYAFTTKSLFVGHLDYNYVRWQVIDTPGVLDHPLADRNSIEMTAITALAHLPAAILFFIDVSEMCGFLLTDQVALFHSIKPLFRNRPLLIILNKTDLRKVSELSQEEQELIKSMTDDSTHDRPIEVFETSCMLREGVDQARMRACDWLLDMRVSQKTKSGKADVVRARIHMTDVQRREDRPPCIPQSIVDKKNGIVEEQMKGEDDEEFETEKDRMIRLGGAGVYYPDYCKKAILDNPDWKYDVIPEFLDGKNVYDFIDPDIDAKLEALEREEALLLEEAKTWDDDEVLKEFYELKGMRGEMHSMRRQKKLEGSLNKARNHHQVKRKVTRSMSEVVEEMELLGHDTSKIRGRAKQRQNTLKRLRSASMSLGDDDDVSAPARKFLRARSLSLSKGFSSEEAGLKAEIQRRKKMKTRNKLGKKGENDRTIPDWKPKHLYTGKHGIKTNPYR